MPLTAMTLSLKARSTRAMVICPVWISRSSFPVRASQNRINGMLPDAEIRVLLSAKKRSPFRPRKFSVRYRMVPKRALAPAGNGSPCRSTAILPLVETCAPLSVELSTCKLAFPKPTTVAILATTVKNFARHITATLPWAKSRRCLAATRRAPALHKLKTEYCSIVPQARAPRQRFRVQFEHRQAKTSAPCFGA
jgi:hypothetical protein